MPWIPPIFAGPSDSPSARGANGLPAIPNDSKLRAGTTGEITVDADGMVLSLRQASSALFLASSAARYITGSTLDVDGGYRST